MGDLIARPSALQLGLENMSPQGQRILEAGCGTGYFARLIAQGIQQTKNTIVVAYDNNSKMLDEATQEEYKRPLGIRYDLRDITGYHGKSYRSYTNLLPIPSPRLRIGHGDDLLYDPFDLIFCIGVMIHWTDHEIKEFLTEVGKILHPKGKIVISVTHPDLFIPGSPSRCGEINWVQHIPRNPTFQEKYLRYGSPFRERYLDIDGQVFESNVFAYTIEGYLRLFRPFLEVLQIKHLRVRKNHLLHQSWGTHYGYPAFLQFVAKPYL
ncbi:MAG: class I SAM-dependent methyltransferase [Candidatus Moraniibacteriota bacterium]